MTENQAMTLEQRIKDDEECRAEAVELFEQCIYAIVPSAKTNPEFHEKAKLAVEAICQASWARALLRFSESFPPKES